MCVQARMHTHMQESKPTNPLSHPLGLAPCPTSPLTFSKACWVSASARVKALGLCRSFQLLVSCCVCAGLSKYPYIWSWLSKLLRGAWITNCMSPPVILCPRHLLWTVTAALPSQVLHRVKESRVPCIGPLGPDTGENICTQKRAKKAGSAPSDSREGGRWLCCHQNRDLHRAGDRIGQGWVKAPPNFPTVLKTDFSWLRLWSFSRAPVRLFLTVVLIILYSSTSFSALSPFRI